jgi:hypothetical protein
MTEKYYEYIGKEPSLNELYQFIQLHKELYENINIGVIMNYLDFAKHYGGHYYIGGHIKVFPHDKITTENINKASEINKNAEITHQMEIYSKLRSIKELADLEKILDIYYEYKITEEYYAPPCPMNMELYGGEGYRKLAAETTVGKKWIDYLEKYV